MVFQPDSFCVIPSVRQLKDLDYALTLDHLPYVLLGQVHLGNLQQLTSRCHKAGKKVIVNLDLVGGLGNDKVAMKFLKQLFNVDVVIATNPSKADMLRGVGIDVMQRITIMDSMSLDSGIAVLKDTKCSVIELRPGIYALEYLDLFRQVKDADFILAGFVNNLTLVEQARQAGFRGIITSSKELWSYKTTK